MKRHYQPLIPLILIAAPWVLIYAAAHFIKH